MSMHSFMSALQTISKDVAEDCQINTLRTLLFVGQRGTCTQKDVEEFLETSNATTSRNVSYWTERRFDRQEGVGYIERTQDDYDRRMRNLTLTKRGHVFYEKIKGIIG